MGKIIKKVKESDFLTGLIIGLIAGAVFSPFKKGFITIASYNEDCGNVKRTYPKNRK